MLGANFNSLSKQLRVQRGLLFGLLIVGALLAFELFNYSTTEFALSDLLGELKFMGVRWATILSIAFCGIDFAGIARWELHQSRLVCERTRTLVDYVRPVSYPKACSLKVRHIGRRSFGVPGDGRAAPCRTESRQQKTRQSYHKKV